MISPDRSIAVRPRLSLSDDQRKEYREGIMPFVLAAREAHKPLLEVRNQLKFLNGEEAAIAEQISNTPGAQDPNHPLRADLTTVQILREELTHDPTLPLARDQFRVKANALIAEVNRRKAAFAVNANMVNPNATGLMGEKQIPPAPLKNQFTKPDSPVRPHNALGTLPVYREKHINPNLEAAIRGQSRALMVTSIQAAEVSLALVQLVPEHFVKPSKSTPIDIRRPGDLAKEIVDVAHLVGRYDAGLIQPPSADELGSQSADQDRHISTQLRALLAHFLRDELANPHRTEKDLQDFYRQLSDYVRGTAAHITPQHGQIAGSYERLGNIIEGLPGIEGPMLASRLSTNLFQDLGLPCLDYVGESRLAEVMRNIGNSGHWSSGSRAEMTAPGYKLKEDARFRLDKVFDSVSGRLDSGEIDCQKMFDPLESLDYGEHVVRNIFNAADDEQQGILLRALVESNCFRGLSREFRRSMIARGIDRNE